MAATRKNREKRKKSELKKVNLKNNAKCSKITRKTHVLVNRSRKTKQNKVKRKNYSSESVENALKALDTGISIRKAAAAYGIPVATLARRKNHPVEFKTKPGPDTVLSKAIEQDIVNWILYKAERGQPVNKNELLDSVQFYVKMKGIATPFLHNRPGRHWFEGFKKRHSNISIRKPQHLSVSRASVTREDLQEWFDEQEKYLKKNNLLHICPSRIFNCDESSILICPDSDKVLTTKDTRAVYKVADGGKECLTVLFMYSADGTRAPPMLMFAYKEGVPKNIAEKTPRNWGIGISDTGWMNAETFYEYITNVFYPWLIEEKVQFPVIIYLDNHSSHITVPLVGFCRDNQIELIGLYPNCTHVMQPLDIAFFHPFKESWKKTVAKWKMQNNVMKLKKEDFPAVLKMAMHNMLKEKEAIVSGFRASGLAPFNPSAVDYDIFQKRKKNLNLVQEQQDLGNLPEDSTQHLRKFENNLSAELLQEFKDASLTGQWTGDVEKKALYEYWFQIRDTSTGNIQKLTINSVETLVNHKINLVRQESENENFPSNDSLVNENDLQIVTQEVSANRNESLIEVVLINNTSELEENILLESSDINIEFQLDEHIMSNNQAESNLGSRLTTTDFEEVCNSSSEGNIEVNKENNNMIANKGADINPDECFAKAFTLPIEYLPKKKKMKVEGSGKPKLPAAGTADEWWKYNIEKERKKEQREQKLTKKKQLQDEKKKLAEEKKILAQKMKEIAQTIKRETK